MLLSRAFKNELANNLHLSIPLIASQIVYSCSNFLGTAMVARLGHEALAAGVLTSLVWLTIANFFLGVLCAVSVLVSHQYGAKKYRLISKIMGQSFLFGIIASIFMALILLSVPYFLHWTTQPPTVIRLATEYIYALVWTIPGLVFLVIVEQFLIGIRQAKAALIISLLEVPIEIVLIYGFVFGKLGLPKCGIAGIGYGFVVTYTMTSIGLAIYMLRSKYHQKFAIFSRITQFNLPIFKELNRVGLPIGFIYAVELGILSIATFFMARFGTVTLAAHQIVMQYVGIIMTFVTSMSQAVTARVGYLAGQQSLPGIKHAVHAGIFINFCITFVIALLLWLVPTWLISLDVDTHDPHNHELIIETIPLLFIVGVFFLIENFRFIEFGALRGLKDTRFCMLVSIVCFWVISLGAAYLFGFVFNFKGTGIWWGLTSGVLVGAIALYYRRKWLLDRVDLKKISTLQGEH